MGFGVKGLGGSTLGRRGGQVDDGGVGVGGHIRANVEARDVPHHLGFREDRRRVQLLTEISSLTKYWSEST